MPNAMLWWTRDQGSWPLPRLVGAYGAQIEKGSAILRCGEYMLPVWIAARVSLMIDQKEQDILRLKLGIEDEGEEE